MNVALFSMRELSEFIVIFSLFWLFVQSVTFQGSGKNGNLRLCVVEGSGAYRKAALFCPTLDTDKSRIECVIGSDRLDCLRRMGKGTVDFGVFSPEDLLAAQWADLDVLVTNEIRSRDREFESSIVAVISNNILSADGDGVEAILRNRTLCHPGTGNIHNRKLTDTLVKYLESLVTERSCDPDMTLEENSIKSLTSFFGKACKPGPWVLDPHRDEQLKLKYRSLCSACTSWRCGTTDPYWGSMGGLTCLTDGAGDATWAQLDDVRSFFGLTRPDGFSFLCRDGTTQPVANNSEPCVWLHRPWPVVATKRRSAEAVTQLAWSLRNSSVTDGDWRAALERLLEVRAPPPPLQPPRTPLDHLARAKGYREAYSQSGCSPSRHVAVCTSSPLEYNKCTWLSEAAAVYGVLPPLQCATRASLPECLRAVEGRDADVVMADADWLIPAQRDYHLQPLLFEYTPMLEQLNIIVPYVRNDSNLSKMADLRGKRAAFPTHNGVAWHSVIRYLTNSTDIESCSVVHLADYFGDSCAPGIENDDSIKSEIRDKFSKTCRKLAEGSTNGEHEALRSLVERENDVAFISLRTYKEYIGMQIQEKWAAENKGIVPLCPEGSGTYCLLSWSSLGQVYANRNVTDMRKQEIVNVFKKLDQLFGKVYSFDTAMFSLYGSFNHKDDVLFHNNTRLLATNDQMFAHPYVQMPYNFERNLSKYAFDSCHTNNTNKMASSSLIVLPLAILVFLIIF